MTETSINYAKALYELSVPEEAVLETEKIFRSTPQLKGALENPLVSLKEKEVFEKCLIKLRRNTEKTWKRIFISIVR